MPATNELRAKTAMRDLVTEMPSELATAEFSFIHTQFRPGCPRTMARNPPQTMNAIRQSRYHHALSVEISQPRTDGMPIWHHKAAVSFTSTSARERKSDV